MRILIAAHSPESERLWQEKLNPAEHQVLAAVRSGRDAFDSVRSLRPDAVLADAFLPLWDGAELARRILTAPIPVRPGCVVAFPPAAPRNVAGLVPPGGAEVLFQPFDGEVLRDALHRLNPSRRELPEQLMRALEETLDSLSIPVHPGRDYLARAAKAVFFDERLLQNRTRILYPLSGESYGVDGVRVERAIRHAIDTAWKRGAIERQYALFRGTIDAQRGKPTTGEMIARLADVLRQEATRL